VPRKYSEDGGSDHPEAGSFKVDATEMSSGIKFWEEVLARLNPFCRPEMADIPLQDSKGKYGALLLK